MADAVPVTLAAKPARKPKPLDWIYWGVFTGCLVPLGILLVGLVNGSLNFNLELDVVLNQLGYLGLCLLLASLACTPLRLVFGLTWPSKLRKTLGLFGFMYIALHATLYFKKQSFSVATVYREVIASQFIFYGLLAFLLLIPLALTSTNGMIKRLGGKRWQMLHKLVYVIGILGVVHFYFRIKGNDKHEALVCGGILALLLGVRVYKWLTRKKRAPVKA